MFKNTRGFLFAVVSTLALSACGGGSVGGDGNNNPDPVDPTGPSSTPTAIALVSTTDVLRADADQVSEGVPFTAIVTDANGNTVSGVPIVFQLVAPDNIGAITVTSATTGSEGTASAVLTTNGNTTLRTIRVRARSGSLVSPPRSITVVNPSTPVDPVTVTSVQLFASSPYLFNDANTSSEAVTLTAVALNNDGNVVPNVAVSFRVTLVSGSGNPGAIQVVRGTTDSTGTATALLTTSGNSSARVVRVTASVTAGGATLTNNPPLELSVVARADEINGTLSSNRLYADNSIPVTVTFRALNSDGNPVANVPVAISVSSGALSASSVTTGADGRTPPVTISTGGNATPRAIEVSASSPGATGATATINVVPAVSTIQVTTGSNRLLDAPGTSVLVTALVRAADGTVLSDVPVRFTVSGPSGRNGAIQPTSTPSVTGADGRATASLTIGNALAGDVLTVAASFDRNPPLAPVTSSSTVEVISQIASVDLIASSSQLSSAATQVANGVTLTALVKDRDQNVVSGATVSFVIVGSQGLITPVRLTTDASGTAQAVLTTGGDPMDRAITVRATSASSSKDVVINVVGTRLSITGPTSVQEGVPTDYIATLVDDAGRGISGKIITLTSSSGTVTAVDASTNVNGQMTFRLSAGSQATATLTATALGETATQSLNITNDSLVFVNLPAQGGLNTDITVRVRWLRSGSPVIGRPVTFSTSRGTLLAPVTVNTNGSGEATATLRSAEAGVATLIARGVDNTTSPQRTPIVLSDLLFVATNPASVVVQAEPTVIGPNQQSTISAVVRDAAGNLVKDVTVNFSVVDSTGGRLSAGSAITDTQGSASVLYTATSTPSSLDGVKITARVGSTAITSQVAVTVGSRSARIVLGTGNTLRESADETLYELPYSAIVTDNAGNPAPDATLRLTLNPTYYYKGYYVQDIIANQWVPVITAECRSEDLNNDGIIDAGEDVDRDGQLDPSNPGTVSNPSPVLSSSGVAGFDVIYPQDRGNWVKVQLTARASVSGTEAIERADFVLPVLADDLELDSTPPGQPSPFGILSRCDLDDSLVPRVSIAPGSVTVTATEEAADSVVNITAQLSKPFTEAVIVTVALDTSNIDLDNQADIDRNSVARDVELDTTQIEFPIGATTANIRIVIKADAVTERAESFNVRLGTVLTNNTIRVSGSNQRALVTIPAND